MRDYLNPSRIYVGVSNLETTEESSADKKCGNPQKLNEAIMTTINYLHKTLDDMERLYGIKPKEADNV